MSNETAPGQNKEVSIIVNAKKKTFSKKIITFKEVIELAFNVYEINPNISYTVEYLKGEHDQKEGMLLKGEEVKVKDGMIFDVTRTDKS